jgi:RNA polymerase sigma-70 factor, ECF subfamily
VNRERVELETEIARHLDAGDHAAAACAILRGYGVEILAYLVAVTRDPVVADEVFSAVSEDLWRGLPGFRRESSARTWLYCLAWHAFVRRREDAFVRRRTTLSKAFEEVAQEVRSRTASFLRTDVKDTFSRLREQLNAQEQTLLILRVDRDLSWREVAEVLSTPEAPITEAVLAKRFERVKTKLRRLAEEAGLLPRE